MQRSTKPVLSGHKKRQLKKKDDMQRAAAKSKPKLTQFFKEQQPVNTEVPCSNGASSNVQPETPATTESFALSLLQNDEHIQAQSSHDKYVMILDIILNAKNCFRLFRVDVRTEEETHCLSLLSVPNKDEKDKCRANGAFQN